MNDDSRFACNICLEPVVEPIVTLCGHLFCWACLFRWSQRTDPLVCPVCKSFVPDEGVIPLYVVSRWRSRDATSVKESSYSGPSGSNEASGTTVGNVNRFLSPSKGDATDSAQPVPSRPPPPTSRILLRQHEQLSSSRAPHVPVEESVRFVRCGDSGSTDVATFSLSEFSGTLKSLEIESPSCSLFLAFISPLLRQRVTLFPILTSENERIYVDDNT